jgi:hypothetical protein
MSMTNVHDTPTDAQTLDAVVQTVRDASEWFSAALDDIDDLIIAAGLDQVLASDDDARYCFDELVARRGDLEEVQGLLDALHARLDNERER